jgi:hypothetical protein
MEVDYQRLLRVEWLGADEPAVDAVIQKDVFPLEPLRCRVEIYITIRIETVLFGDHHLCHYKASLPAVQGMTEEGDV